MQLFSKLSLQIRVLFIVTLACALCAAIAIGGFMHFNRKELENGIINKERTIHTQLAAATDFVAKQGGLSDVIEKFKRKYTSAEQISKEERIEILNQVPIYSAMVIGKKNAEVDRYQFRVFSDEPRRKENRATAQELEILKRFDTDPSLAEYIFNDGEFITLYRPVRLHESKGCLTCHGAPSTSPWGNGTDILGYKMENWQDGKLHGVFAISQNIKEIAAASTEGQLVTPAGWLILAISFGALIAVFFGFLMIKGPLGGLSRVATVLAQATAKVTSASGQIASSSEQLSQAATEQAASLEQTAASLEQITAMIAKASGNADATSSSSATSQDKAEEGGAAIRLMLKSMDEISESNEVIKNQVVDSNRQLTDIVNLIHDIGSKTKVINEIVFQTKLLSFNASVEAARAGEHGKGFSVVAEEVGNLAQMSGNAAREISLMLDGSVSKVESIVHETKSKVESLVLQGKGKVESGSRVAHQCSDVLSEIVQNVRQVSSLAQEISQASREQAQGVGEINKAMGQLDLVTQKNSSTSIEVAGAAEQLSSQADSLRTVVDELLTIIKGKR